MAIPLQSHKIKISHATQIVPSTKDLLTLELLSSSSHDGGRGQTWIQIPSTHTWVNQCSVELHSLIPDLIPCRPWPIEEPLERSQDGFPEFQFEEVHVEVDLASQHPADILLPYVSTSSVWDLVKILSTPPVL
ncbi:hypothetical protein VNO77_27092 [Canavalia gladiata]|uniref:Uncharacterized protein n=1 Tax=Canavalia gladiata TaxID=3824 RepID=A0AAN9Q663_CANGL